jgi:hypoxanthine phosphoribosyltransferase
MHADVERILISAERLDERVSALAREIATAYGTGCEGITIVTILAGSIVFLGDLIRKLPMKMRIGLVGVSSYPGRSVESRGAVLSSGALPDIRGHDVLIVDDILDTGGTLRLVQAEIGRASPRSVRTVVLLRKPGKAPSDVAVDFVGFDIEDTFVVGYGLDFDGLYRNLPYIATLKRSSLEEHRSA